jgi:hypothetical protein
MYEGRWWKSTLRDLLSARLEAGRSNELLPFHAVWPCNNMFAINGDMSSFVTKNL